MKPLVSVAIITWNRSEEVKRAVQSVFNQPYRPVEVVVVDSASTDNTVSMLQSNFPDITLIRLHRNLGCPEGRNVAYANCKGEFIFSLDDDGWLDQSTIANTIKAFKKDNQIGIVACQIYEPKGPRYREGSFFTAEFSGGACGLRAALLENVGYFPYDFLRQAEETDYALRVLDSGYKILYDSQAKINHHPLVINQIAKKRYFFNVRNDLVIVVRRYPWILVVPILLQKLFIWLWVGLKNRTLGWTLWGIMAAGCRIPNSLLMRNPVSFKTATTFIKLRKQSPLKQHV